MGGGWGEQVSAPGTSRGKAQTVSYGKQSPEGQAMVLAALTGPVVCSAACCPLRPVLELRSVCAVCWEEQPDAAQDQKPGAELRSSLNGCGGVRHHGAALYHGPLRSGDPCLCFSLFTRESESYKITC